MGELLSSGENASKTPTSYMLFSICTGAYYPIGWSLYLILLSTTDPDAKHSALTGMLATGLDNFKLSILLLGSDN